MTALDGLPPLRDVVRRHGIAAKKSLGQNFLFDLNLTARIVRSAGPLDDANVIEVGPGPGGLTRALLAHGAAHVTAIERDDRCAAALEEISGHYPGRLTIIQDDALEVDYRQLTKRFTGHHSVKIVANLPYNIATPLLTRWLENGIENAARVAAPAQPVWDQMILMFQKEVAARITATPAERADYGRLAVLCGWLTQSRILFDVPREAFTPPPKVTSSVVELRPLSAPVPCSLEILSAVTRAAFGQRRKMVRQSLKTLPLPGGSTDIAGLLGMTDIDPRLRADAIPVNSYIRLANAIAGMAGRNSASASS